MLEQLSCEMDRSRPLVDRVVEGSWRRIWERRELKAVKVVSFRCCGWLVARK